MPKSELTSEGLKNSLKSYDLKNAIVEYVWNGFDANATRIDIEQVLMNLVVQQKSKLKIMGVVLTLTNYIKNSVHHMYRKRKIRIIQME